MSTALSLLAGSTIQSGQGLAINPLIIARIAQLQNKTELVQLSSVFTAANSYTGNSLANVQTALANIGNGVVRGSWLLDMYPANITATSSGNVHYHLTIPNKSTASFTNTLAIQANIPWTDGMEGFSHAFNTSYSFITQSFDTAASVALLKDKTFDDVGVGYTTPVDLATFGAGNVAKIIGNVVSNWGTMYDCNNIANMSDVYVFGQNILNQRLGKFGSLAEKLRNVGLDTSNLSRVPTPASFSVFEEITIPKQTVLGSVPLSTVGEKVYRTNVPGKSQQVVHNIYKTITAANLQSIVEATGITTFQGNSIRSLDDYFDLSKVVNPADYAKLSSYGISSLYRLGLFLQPKIGQSRFKNWREVGNLLSNISVPAIANVEAISSKTDKLLSDSDVQTILSNVAIGSNALGAATIFDVLGATSGSPYNDLLTTVSTNYTTVANDINLSSLLSSLLTAVQTAPYLNPSQPTYGVDTTAISANVTAINEAIKSLYRTTPSSLISSPSYGFETIGLVRPGFVEANPLLGPTDQAYIDMIKQLNIEVANIDKGGITFGNTESEFANKQLLRIFSQQFSSWATDNDKFLTKQFFDNLITEDAAGDKLKLANSEAMNTRLFNRNGVAKDNDPRPDELIEQARRLSLPLSTVISRNK